VEGGGWARGVDAGVSHCDGDAEFGGEVPLPADLSAVSAGDVLRRCVCAGGGNDGF
jgi:hypothetical protein